MTGQDTPGGLETALDRTRTTLEDTNRRLDKLDRRSAWQWWAVGALVLALFGVGYVVVARWQEDRSDDRAAAEAERTRCEDAVEGRADLRQGIAGVVALIFAEAQDPAALEPLLADVGDYLATQYPLPACVERLGLEVTPPTAPTSQPLVPPSPPASPAPPSTSVP